VRESEVKLAKAMAAAQGWFVEASAAVAVAGVRRLADQFSPSQTTVLVLTGSGMKD
jgi:threonine synthase